MSYESYTIFYDELQKLRKLRKLQNSYELTIFQSNVLWCNPQNPKNQKKHKSPKDIGVWGRQSKKQIKPKNNKTKTKTYFNPICIIKQ